MAVRTVITSNKILYLEMTSPIAEQDRKRERESESEGEKEEKTQLKDKFCVSALRTFALPTYITVS